MAEARPSPITVPWPRGRSPSALATCVWSVVGATSTFGSSANDTNDTAKSGGSCWQERLRRGLRSREPVRLARRSRPSSWTRRSRARSSGWPCSSPPGTARPRSRATRPPRSRGSAAASGASRGSDGTESVPWPVWSVMPTTSSSHACRSAGLGRLLRRLRSDEVHDRDADHDDEEGDQDGKHVSEATCPNPAPRGCWRRSRSSCASRPAARRRRRNVVAEPSASPATSPPHTVAADHLSSRALARGRRSIRSTRRGPTRSTRRSPVATCRSPSGSGTGIVYRTSVRSRACSRPTRSS